ncbi:MAG: hypothetical protein AAFX56_00885 [Pseudomonadota bacterium]
MAFQALSESQKAALATLQTARTTRDRAELSRHLALTRLDFLEQARPLLDGDPWLLTESEKVQAAYRAHHAETSGLEYNRLAEALFWLEETEKLLADAALTLSGEPEHG